jgi:hypothetical protein
VQKFAERQVCIAETQRQGTARFTNCVSHVARTSNSTDAISNAVVLLSFCTYIPHAFKATVEIYPECRQQPVMTVCSHLRFENSK